MKILVTGVNGQLGSELKKKSSIKTNFEWLFTDRLALDLSDLNTISMYLDIFKPQIIINCAAYTLVDKAEDDFKLANIINHKAVGLIAEWCKKNNCKLLHISSDYVYSGNSKIPYVEEDETAPLNNYGKTKLHGDIACLENNSSSTIIRTSWLYSSFGNNFLSKMINLMHDREEIEVVDDQFGSPTYASDLADTIIDLIINKKWHPGIYNYTNYGEVSWYNFANKIKSLYGFDTIIKPVSSVDYFQKALRPKYSLLDNSKIINTFKIKQIDYLVSLRKCIKIMKNES